jgi:tRNA/tmRNA/rRNA uracil-C5-methylase (TrmA/RlmC/RlmD family)
MYLHDPFSAPLVRDARAYFSAQGVVRFRAHVGPVAGWRTVAKLAVRSTAADVSSYYRQPDLERRIFKAPLIGLFEPGSHDVVPGSGVCPAHHPSINKAVGLVEQAIIQSKTFGYVEGSEIGTAATNALTLKSGFLRYILLSVQRSTGKVQLSIVWNTAAPSAGMNRKSDELLGNFTDSLLRNAGQNTISLMEVDTEETKNRNSLFHSIYVHYHSGDRHDNSITGREEGSWKLIFGEEFLEEVIDTDVCPTLHFPPFVFRQANIDQFSEIIRAIRHWIKDCNTKLSEGSDKEKLKRVRCLELYGGVGTIGLNCVDLVKSLQCSDENPHNKVCFERSVSLLPSSKLQSRAVYDPVNAERASQVLFSEDLAFDLCIVDPPRKGLDPEVLKALLYYDITKKRPLKRLIYVSCGFKAFKRDAAILTGQDWLPPGVLRGVPTRTWRLVHAEGHILFPGADHIETLAVFDRD